MGLGQVIVVTHIFREVFNFFVQRAVEVALVVVLYRLSPVQLSR